MRLTCPNCSARYEVDDQMIPPEGRDVQCSNCSTTWFQPGPRSAAAAPNPAPADEPEPPAETADAAEPPAAARRELDPDVRALLREEAEREARLRRGAPETVETQEEMALPEGQAAPRPGADATPRDLPEAEDNFDDDDDVEIDEAIAATMAAGSRRDLLPDIEEINSTLRATSDRNPDESEASDVETIDMIPRRRRGLRLGFGLTLLVAAGLVMVYTNAGYIAERMPQATPALQAYVENVNTVRFWLDDLAQGALDGANDPPATQ